jgi:prevent-host-death family protein
MSKVIPIHEAKTHLSKYIKQAKGGKPVSIGAYGLEEVMLISAKPKKKPLKFDIWAHKPKGYKDKDIVGPDPDIIQDFEDAVNKPFPE